MVAELANTVREAGLGSAVEKAVLVSDVWSCPLPMWMWRGPRACVGSVWVAEWAGYGEETVW